MFNDPCDVCGVVRLDHRPTEIRHRYRSPVLPPEAFYHCEFWDILNDATAGTVERAIQRHAEGAAKYNSSLPSPDDRKRIRVRAGLTQQALADELLVSRWTVTRWEKPAGYRRGVRLPGREPVGALRAAYSNLLRDLTQR
jgi:hypothetical protein